MLRDNVVDKALLERHLAITASVFVAVSGFLRGIKELLAVLRCYAAYIDGCLPIMNNLSVPE